MSRGGTCPLHPNKPASAQRLHACALMLPFLSQEDLDGWEELVGPEGCLDGLFDAGGLNSPSFGWLPAVAAAAGVDEGMTHDGLASALSVGVSASSESGSAPPAPRSVASAASADVQPSAPPCHGTNDVYDADDAGSSAPGPDAASGGSVVSGDALRRPASPVLRRHRPSGSRALSSRRP